MTNDINVLIIDDEALDRKAIRREIQSVQRSVTFVEASNLDQGVALLSESKVSIVLLDFRLPGCNGLESLKALQSSMTEQIPIIMVSGLEDEETMMEQCIANGAQDYLLKNELTGRQILRSIRYAIHRNQVDGELRQALKRAMEAQEAAEKANQAKSQFIANISHDLRTPFTSIQGSLQLIAGNVFPGVPAEAMELVNMALNNTERLLRIVNDLLDLKKMEAGELSYQMEPHRIHDIITQAQGAIEHFASELNIRIYSELDGCESLNVFTDDQRVNQLLVNILSNAIKFANSTIKIEVGELESEMAVIKVHDDGVGISGDDIERVFEPFYQTDLSTTSSRKGTGLGLAICKQLATDMKGSISLQSELGIGTTVEIKLPQQAC